MVKNYINFLQFILFFIFLSVLPSQIQAQCAGVGVNYDVCDIPNTSSQSINLFSLLVDNPTAGGTWTDDDFSQGLDASTGILNAQLITRSGIYRYTYTVSVPGCADNSATISVAIGGYAGVTGPASSACTDSSSYDLFHVFNGNFLSPQSNGDWYNNTTGAGVRGSFMNPMELGVGTYQFTYSFPAVRNCPPPASVTAFVTVYRAPEAGTPADLILCSSDDLSLYSNLDLNSRLTGQDPGGKWTDESATGELTTVNDHFIDVQKIYNTRGEGEYNFTYTVLAPNPICKLDLVTVRIRIEKRYDFSGGTLNVKSDICEADISRATYSATITRGADIIPNARYYVTYNVSGPSVSLDRTDLLTINNGTVTFPLSSGYFQKVGAYTIKITKIRAFSSEKDCVNIVDNLSAVLNISPAPNIDLAKLKIDPVCQNKMAMVQITGISNLSDGRYDIIYKLGGANVSIAQTASIDVLNGAASFNIPSALINNDGNTLVVITNIINTLTHCANTANVTENMVVKPLPNPAIVKLVVNDNCFSQAFSVAVSGLGNLTDATLSYTLSDSNSSTLQPINLTVVGGNASFVIPAGLLLNTGSTKITANNLINNATTCEVTLNVSDDFLINPIPLAPVAGNQEFCKVDRATIANLVPHGPQYKWYSSAALTTALADTYVLKSEGLYVTETSAANCTSPSSMISVVVNDTPAPTLNAGGENFCGLKNPTIADLSKATTVPSTVAWYDARDNGNLLTSTALLNDKATYYGYDLSTVTNCISNEVLEVTVSLFDCDPAEYAFFIPDGFSPNGDNINDTFRIPDIEFLYPDYTVEIFNRYGNVLFKGNRNKPNWDGKNSESAGFGDGIAPNGVYFYIVNFNKDNRKAQQGRLYLNR